MTPWEIATYPGMQIVWALLLLIVSVPLWGDPPHA